MDPSVQQYLNNNPQLAEFIRYNPMWYRYLMRDPSSIDEMKKEAKKFYGKTIPQQVDTISGQIQMAHMLAKMAKAMKD